MRFFNSAGLACENDVDVRQSRNWWGQIFGRVVFGLVFFGFIGGMTLMLFRERS
jgi:hypothetical protein